MYVVHRIYWLVVDFISFIFDVCCMFASTNNNNEILI